jgi:hypothetical protein
MPRDDVGIPRSGATNQKGVGYTSWRGTTILMSAILFSLDLFIQTETSLTFAIQSLARNAQRPTLNSKLSKT